MVGKHETDHIELGHCWYTNFGFRPRPRPSLLMHPWWVKGVCCRTPPPPLGAISNGLYSIHKEAANGRAVTCVWMSFFSLQAVLGGGRLTWCWGGTYGGRPGQRVEEQGTWAAQKHSEAGYGRPVDGGVWTAKTVKRPRQQPAHPQYANYWAPLTRKRHTMPHSAQSQHANYWAPRTRKRHQQEHRPQRPTESSDPTQHAKGRTGHRPGPRKGATTRRNVTQGGRRHGMEMRAVQPSSRAHGSKAQTVCLPSRPFCHPCLCRLLFCARLRFY